MFERKRIKTILDSRSPYPWYDYPDRFGYRDRRAGRRELRDDLEAISGCTLDQISDENRKKLQWLFKNGFLLKMYDDDGQPVIYYSGKPIR